MQAAEGKLFHPLAFTKTFALISAFILGIVVLPTLTYLFFSIRIDTKRIRKIWNGGLFVAGILFVIFWHTWPALALIAIGINNLFDDRWKEHKEYPNYINIAITVLVAAWYLTIEWLPLGAHNSILENYLFVSGIIALILVALMSMVHFYEEIIRWALENKWKFLVIPAATLLLGFLAWQGFDKTFGVIATGAEKAGWKSIRQTSFWQNHEKTFPGIGNEIYAIIKRRFISADAYQYAACQEFRRTLNTSKCWIKRLSAIPEVEVAVGKWGRVNSALDPAPVQMFENTINYRSEYILDENGQRIQFKVDRDGSYVLKSGSKYNTKKEGFKVFPADSLISDANGEYFRQWRPEIKKPNDIWNEIVKVTNIPGLTSAPKLQPIETRLIMLSTGMRAPMGLKVYGPDLNAIEQGGMQLEKALKEVPSIKGSSVFYDRAVGAPYLEIKLNREAMARYGMSVSDVQEVLSVAGGRNGSFNIR